MKKENTAVVAADAKIGQGTRIWHHAQIREEVVIGENCIVGKNAYIDRGVIVGKNTKIQNNAMIYADAVIGEGVFIGPNVSILNDKYPRAASPEGKPKKEGEWRRGRTVIGKGASIGGSSVILPNLTIGQHAMVGAGSVVTKDVPQNALVYGNPAEGHGWVCPCGNKISKGSEECKECAGSG